MKKSEAEFASIYVWYNQRTDQIEIFMKVWHLCLKFLVSSGNSNLIYLGKL